MGEGFFDQDDNIDLAEYEDQARHPRCPKCGTLMAEPCKVHKPDTSGMCTVCGCNSMFHHD